MNVGIFVISLDYEMLWGAIFNKSVENGYRCRTQYIGEIIPALLNLFERYHIHATWATVGAIACDSKEQALQHASKMIYDPYSSQSLIDFIKSIQPTDEFVYFSPKVVKEISSCAGQEIGSHTYTHFYFNEHTDALSKLNEELEASKIILEKKTNKKVVSLVMPKNQVAEDIKKSMSKNGMSIYRGVQVSRRFNKHNKFFRIIHFLDSYIPVCGDSTYTLNEIKEEDYYNVRASAFWRTYYRHLGCFEYLKLWRIKKQMMYAAKKGKIFHLWFHPHNLGMEYIKNLKMLESILIYYKYLNKKYGMISCNMSECAKIYDDFLDKKSNNKQ